MSDGAYRQLAAAILVAHQRRDIGPACMCGWDRLGYSWADHVAEVLDRAGALRDRPPAPENPPETEHYEP